MTKQFDEWIKEKIIREEREREDKRDKCLIPNCPERDQTPLKIDPKCRCKEGSMIYLPPGKHYHPCPVHLESVIRGQDIRTL
jgi:hypothetical protein